MGIANLLFPSSAVPGGGCPEPHPFPPGTLSIVPLFDMARYIAACFIKSLKTFVCGTSSHFNFDPRTLNCMKNDKVLHHPVLHAVPKNILVYYDFVPLQFSSRNVALVL